MKSSNRKSKIIEHIKVCDNIFKIKAEFPEKAQPGQFFMVRASEDYPTLSRPISVHDSDDNSVTFLFEAKGKGTDMLASLAVDDSIYLTGPLGNGFPVDDIKGKVAVVSGGIGIAPLNYVVKSLSADVDFFCGFRDKSYALDEISKVAKNVSIATDTGNEGVKGFVTDLLDVTKYDVVVTCGPEIMMKKLVSTCLSKNVKIYVSLEKHMACGIGACLGCTCKTKNGAKRVCKDGPVFLGEDVVFDA